MKRTTFDDYQKRLLRVLVFIQKNLDEELSLDRLAAVAHFSPYHFHRIFRGMVGESLQAHIRRLRLERAAWRLKRTTDPITSVALDAGYQTHEAFSRAFRSLTGLSPSTFRARRPAAAPRPVPSRIHFDPSGRLVDFQPLAAGGPAMNVQIKKMEALRIAYIRHVGPYQECGKAWEALLPRLGAEGHLGPGVSLLGICHDDPEVTPPEQVRYDACVTVGEDFRPEGSIRVKTIPAGEYAFTTHQGSYATLGETYTKLIGQWIPRSGRRLRPEPCLEFYLNDPESTEPQELLTDIYVPLAPDQEPANPKQQEAT